MKLLAITIALLAAVVPGHGRTVQQNNLAGLFTEGYGGGNVCLSEFQRAIIEVAAVPYYTKHLGPFCLSERQFVKLARLIEKADLSDMFDVYAPKEPVDDNADPHMMDYVYVPPDGEPQSPAMLRELNESRARLAYWMIQFLGR
ncbi:hypothetical protein K470DRAFT_258802 [Piedraia hortae CBS 480.64]|uniref:Uncharacterized protein n=1 Tax=Piedraia hortae CBS 480.64 TaxID=1314780 RepID=A0A6A7BW76_9PEZI|nr:hypothetical protein K470DRAFT_258802 [Piedraia hortae CBS 480.64]